MKKGIAILGSTGSIGIQALEVISENNDLFDVEVLTANENSQLLIKQAKLNNPNSGEVVLYPLKTKQNIYIAQITFENIRSASPSGLLSKIRSLKMPSKNKVNQVNLSKTPTLVVMATSRYLVDSLEKIHYFLGCFRLYL